MQRNDPPKLHFAYAPTEPDLSAVDVKRVVPASLLGDPAALTVIGESHYVGVPALSFHEVCSCRPTAGETADVTAVVALERGVERSVSFETDRVRAGTRVEVRPLDAFPGAEGADAAFRFGPEAWTTISLGGGVAPDESDATDSDETPAVGAASDPTPSTGAASDPTPSAGADASAPAAAATYETYHTYPEYDLAVYTETTLSRGSKYRTTNDGN